jgi:DNA adenine methylase
MLKQPMQQIELFDRTTMQSSPLTLSKDARPKIVNVASVPHRSPFRYAGGKTWLVPQIRAWLADRGGPAKALLEPFAGGGIVSLTAASEGLVGQVIMIEKDEDVAAVWRVILGDGGEWLAAKIVNFQLTVDSAKQVIAKADRSLEDRAFATIIKNRVNRGGILADGASFIKQGENGKGITSRWYPETLKKRILAIVAIKHKIQFIQADAFDIYAQYLEQKDLLHFIDPPYVKAGQRLYRHCEIDHAALFNLTTQLCGDFLITYDNVSAIQTLVNTCKLDVRLIPMKSTHHIQKTEMLIGRNLDWF